MKWVSAVTYSAIALALSGCNPAANNSGDAAKTASVSFAGDVKPIFQRHCSDCHLDGNRKGGYSLETHTSAIEAGQKGARIAPGDSAGSNLIQRVRAAEGVKRMPPKGDLLTASEVATIAAWIDQGASQE